MASGHFKNGAVVESFTSTATSGGLLTLTSSSDAYQVFTGTSSHTLKLPDATTLILNQKFEVVNGSTDAITVQNNGGTTISTVDAGVSKVFRVVDISSANGEFDATAASAGGSGTLSAADAALFAALSPKGFTAQSRALKYNPEEISGKALVITAPLIQQLAWPVGASLNGYGYSFAGTNNSGSETAVNYRYNDDSNYHRTMTALSSNKTNGSSFVLNGKAYAVGGHASTGDSQAYNDATDSWAAITSIGTAQRRGGAGFATRHGYIAGGTDGASASLALSLYDDVTNAWTTRQPMTAAKVGAGAFLADSKAYVVAGSTDAGATSPAATMFIYDADQNTWSSGTSRTTALSQFGTASASSQSTPSSASVGGGYTGTVSATTSEEYFPALKTWQTAVGLSTARHGLGGYNLNGVGYIFGGRIIPASTYSSVMEKYVNVSLFSLGSLKRASLTPSSIYAAAILSSATPAVQVQLRTDNDEWKNFLSGESSLKLNETAKVKFYEADQMNVGPGSDGSTHYATTETYNDQSNTWQARTGATTTGGGYGSFPLEGLQYFVGLHSVSNLTRTFSDALNAWGTKANLPSSFGNNSAARHNGFGYSLSTGNNTTTVYKYNATTNAWSTATSMGVGRGAPASSSVGGRLFVVGGTVSSGVGRVSTEYYDDVANTWTTLGSGSNSPDTSQSGGTYGNMAFQLDNFAYHGGNGSGVSGSDFAAKFDVSTFSWSLVASMPFFKYIPYSGSLNGHGYVCAGHNGTAYNTACAKYNPASNAWSTITSVSGTGRGSVAMSKSGTSSYRNYELRIGVPALYAGVGGFQYVARANLLTAASYEGCASLNGDFLTYGTVSQMYNSTSNFWKYYTTHPSGSGLKASFVLGGLGYASTDNSAAWHAVNTNTGVWTAVASMNNTRTRLWASSGSSFDGYGYVMGGTGAGYTGYVTTTEQYNSSTNAWTNKAALNSTELTIYTGRGVLSGFLYAVTGYGVGRNQLVMKYDAVANSWTNKNNYPLVLAAVACTNLNGVLYGVGGFNASNVHVSNSYLYNEPADSWTSAQSYPSAVSGMTVDGKTGLHVGGDGGSTLSIVYQMTDSVKQAVLSAGLKVS